METLHSLSLTLVSCVPFGRISEKILETPLDFFSSFSQQTPARAIFGSRGEKDRLFQLFNMGYYVPDVLEWVIDWLSQQYERLSIASRGYHVFTAT